MVSGRSGSLVEESGIGVALSEGVDVREGEGEGEDIVVMVSLVNVSFWVVLIFRDEARKAAGFKVVPR